MPRKGTPPLPAGGGESSKPQEAAGGSSSGTPRQPERGAPPQQGPGGAGYQGGRGYAPQTQQDRGRGGGPPQGGHGGYGNGRSCGGRGGGPSSGDPSRPPVPKLDQATPSPYPAGVTPQAMSYIKALQNVPQAMSYSKALQNVPPASSKSMRIPLQPGKGSAAMSEASSSSRTPEPSPAAVTQHLSDQQKLALQSPRRPGNGEAGIKCIVKANHFFAKLLDKELYQYDVTIEQVTCGEAVTSKVVTSKVVNRAVMEQLVDLYRVSRLGNHLPVYDGRKLLYTAGRLPFALEDFEITLDDEEDGSVGQRRERKFSVLIKFAALLDIPRLRLFLQGGPDAPQDAPQEVLQALDIVLHEVPSNMYCSIGPSFYSPHLCERRKQPLGEGLESWPGFFQSLRPTQMGMSLNIDTSSKAFIDPLPVMDFVTRFLNPVNSARPLSDPDRVKVEKALSGVKVEVIHHGNKCIKYRIYSLTPQATRDVTFLDEKRGTMTSVVAYFQETYNWRLQHTQWPCLNVGNQQRPTYLPMEVCKIVEGQRYTKLLNQRQITALSEVTCQRPAFREQDILQTVRRNAYDNNPYTEKFGIEISNDLASVEARILPAPSLIYRDDRGRVKDFLPHAGLWSMKNKKMVNGGRVNNWICINFSRKVGDSEAHAFCHKLALRCQIFGMEFALNPLLPPLCSCPNDVESALKDAMTKLRRQGRELDLLIVILPDNNGSLYGDLKRICETDLGIVSQCCLTEHVLKMKEQYLTNVSLKINVKVGGRNTVLVDAMSKNLPVVSDLPTIIFGADVTHAGDDSSPSIAAVVASQDWPQMVKYAGLVSAQAHGQELIEDLYKMVRELLISFYHANGQKQPERIIFYRDGVGEGQFKQVLLNELHAIYEACASIVPSYQPPVTFVVVQKRHHTRLFLDNHPDINSMDGSVLNILPGTVVDSKICHPTKFDFYLCSHRGSRSTSRPAHYHVLFDGNKFTADGLQLLTYKLCYTYARCTQSVSIVPPVYYAHLLASRARFYVESGGMGGGAGGPSVNAVRPIRAHKENLKRVMFYC